MWTSAFGPQNKFVTVVGQGNVSLSMSGDSREVFGVTEGAHPFTTRILKKSVHLWGSAQPVSSVVSWLLEVAYKRRMTRITRHWVVQNSNKIVRRNGGNSPARQLGAVNLTLNTSICAKCPAGSQSQSFWKWCGRYEARKIASSAG